MAVQAPDKLSYRDALASKELRALFTAQLVSIGGSSVAAVALTVLVYRRTSSPLLASLTFALNFLPYLVGGALLSGLVDRIRPRQLAAGCDLGSAVLMLVIALPRMPLLLLFVLLFASGTLSSQSNGARSVLLRAGVTSDGYVPARSLMRIAAQLAQIGGNAGGGLLLVFLSPVGCLLVNAATFVFSAATVRFRVADHPSEGERGEARLIKDSLRGARQVLAIPELRRLMLLCWLAPTFIVAPEALAAPYVTSHGGSSAVVGWWLVALPVALITGDVFGVRRLSAVRQRWIVAPAAAAEFVPFLAFILNPSIPVGMGLLVLAGLCSLYVLGLDARIRDAAPRELFGRAMAVNSSGLIALQGIGFTLAGAVAQLVGPADAVFIAGLCGLVATTVVMRGEVLGRHR